jgi:hypothetical protein
VDGRRLNYWIFEIASAPLSERAVGFEYIDEVMPGTSRRRCQSARRSRAATMISRAVG